jgi:hypothetical protein
MKYVFRSNLLVLALLAGSAPVFSAPSSADDSKPKANVFSVADEDSNNNPRFANSDGKPKLGPKEHVPGWQEIKMIPSLTGERRKLVQELFNKGKSDSAPLQDEMKQIRSQIQQQAEAATGNPTGSATDTNTDTNTTKSSAFKAPAARQDSGSASAKQAVLPGQTTSAAAGDSAPRPAAKGKPTPEQKARMAQIRSQLQEIRAKTWDEVKAMLTEEDQHQLALMREGKLLPDNLQRKPGRPTAIQSAATSNKAEAAASDDSKAMQEN